LRDWIKQQNDSGEGKYYLYTLDDAVELHNRGLVAGAQIVKPPPPPVVHTSADDEIVVPKAP